MHKLFHWWVKTRVEYCTKDFQSQLYHWCLKLLGCRRFSRRRLNPKEMNEESKKLVLGHNCKRHRQLYILEIEEQQMGEQQLQLEEPPEEMASQDL